MKKQILLLSLLLLSSCSAEATSTTTNPKSYDGYIVYNVRTTSNYHCSINYQKGGLLELYEVSDKYIIKTWEPSNYYIHNLKGFNYSGFDELYDYGSYAIIRYLID